MHPLSVRDARVPLPRNLPRCHESEIFAPKFGGYEIKVLNLHPLFRFPARPALRGHEDTVFDRITMNNEVVQERRAALLGCFPGEGN